MTKKPILFIIFDNKETSIKVFEKIKKYTPDKIYIACDWPRENKIWEKEKILELRNLILKSIDWKCEIKTLFRENNIWTSIWIKWFIDWFFENEEMWIILEHDCLPDNSFFNFCEILLDKYKNNENIMHIWGYNLISKEISKEDNFDYFYSNLPVIWWWATWKRAWKKYDFEISDLDIFIKSNILKNIFKNDYKSILWWKEMFKAAKIWNKTWTFSTWDFQWTYSIWKNHWISVIPSKNLVKNIGFWENAVHSKDPNNKLALVKLESLSNSIKSPNKIIINSFLDKKLFSEIFNIKFYSWAIVFIWNISRKLWIYKQIKKIYDKLS